MMPLHPSFRRLVLEHIPDLDREDLDNYDSLIALRLEFVHRRSHVSGLPPIPIKTNPDNQGPKDGAGKPKTGDDPNASRSQFRPPKRRQQGTPREELDHLIEETTRQANKIIEPYRAQFDALHKLWSARRNLALHQGGILQIPSSWEGLKGFVSALGNYFRVQVQTVPVLTKGRLTNPSFIGRWAAIAVMVSMLLYGVSTLKKGDNGNFPPPKDPDSTAVRQ